MPGPNPDAKLEVLVCDDRNRIMEGLVPLLQKRFGGESFADGHWTRWFENAVSQEGTVKFEGERFNLTWVKDLDEVVRQVHAYIPPHYSLVIYGAQHFREKKAVFDLVKTEFEIPHNSIESALKKIEGVNEVSVDYGGKLVSVSIDSSICNSNRLFRAINNLGYAANEITRNDANSRNKIIFRLTKKEIEASSIKQVLQEISGVRKFNVDDKKRRVEVNFDGNVCDYSLIERAINQLGYSSKKIEEAEIQKGGRAISNVRRVDPFMPQMIVGRGIEEEDLMKAARAGCLYYAKTSSSVEEWVNKLFHRPSLLPRCTVIKVGGSSFDYVRQTRSRNLKELCDTLIRVFNERPGGNNKQEAANRFILAVGAGQYGEIEKDDLLIHDGDQRTIEAFPERMAEALIANSKSIHNKMGEKYSSLISTGNFYFVSKEKTKNKIPVMPLAPHYISARDQIPLKDSDTHTIALAEFYGAERVVLVKRTDGIYDHDPYLGFVLDPIIRKCKSIEAWREAQKNNGRHDMVNVEDMLKGDISRIGTSFDIGEFDGSTGHLMEDSALRYFSQCRHVKEIIVVHIAPEEMYYQAGENEYRHVITGETLQLGPEGWKGVMEQRLRDAFQGMAASKIVR